MSTHNEIGLRSDNSVLERNLNNSTLMIYYDMLLHFETIDLHELFEAFGINTTGDLSTLCRRATGILRETQYGLNHQRYQNKIFEIFNALQYIKNKKSVDNKHFIPSKPSMKNIVFKKLSFFRSVGMVIRPTELIGRETQYVMNGTRKQDFTFALTLDQSTDILINRNTDYDAKTSTESEYTHQLQIRFCQFKDNSTEQIDSLPLGLNIRINDKVCILPEFISTECESRQSMPIDCTQYVTIDSRFMNEIRINWTDDGNRYVMAMYIVEKFSSDTLLSKLLNKTPKQYNETKNYIIYNVAVLKFSTPFNVSLKCPISNLRMNFPAKSIYCDHLQCFDAGGFIASNEKKTTWHCPLCHKPCSYDDLQIDVYFLSIVKNRSIRENMIEIFSDGRWKESNMVMHVEIPPYTNMLDYYIQKKKDEHLADSFKERRQIENKTQSNNTNHRMLFQQTTTTSTITSTTTTTNNHQFGSFDNTSNHPNTFQNANTYSQ